MDFSVELDFSAMTTSEPYPDTLDGQGFTILCDGCPQYINIRFDSSISAAQSKYDSTPGLASDGSRNDYAREFIIGVKDVTSSADLAETIFQGISAVSNQIEKSFTVHYYGTVKPSYNISCFSSHVNSSDDILVNAAHEFRIRRDPNDPSKILFTKNNTGMMFKEGTIANPLIDPTIPAKVETKTWNPLWVQHGTQAGQHVNIYINSMQTKDLGIDNVRVTTRDEALAAIGKVESALETALDEATNLGAWLQRLEFTDLNVTTMGENVQNAESTIRDVDMAKEITEYTKYNILTQSSQAMLAQANQNGSAILSLLQ
ncbi:MAG: hypothetical protein IJ685_05335 [Selenomonadaceae bacterium]|nr:hypothetical protein [Selenomonadaceae bacterium]